MEKLDEIIDRISKEIIEGIRDNKLKVILEENFESNDIDKLEKELKDISDIKNAGILNSQNDIFNVMVKQILNKYRLL